MQKTISVRIGEDDYSFVSKLAREQKEELSKAVRELVYLGRLMLAVKEYKSGKASLGKAAELAGIPLSEMMNVLAEFKVKSNVTREDYRAALSSLKKVW